MSKVLSFLAYFSQQH